MGRLFFLRRTVCSNGEMGTSRLIWAGLAFWVGTYALKLPSVSAPLCIRYSARFVFRRIRRIPLSMHFPALVHEPAGRLRRPPLAQSLNPRWRSRAPARHRGRCHPARRAKSAGLLRTIARRSGRGREQAVAKPRIHHFSRWLGSDGPPGTSGNGPSPMTRHLPAVHAGTACGFQRMATSISAIRQSSASIRKTFHSSTSA